MTASVDPGMGIQRESYGRLFMRFLRFGLLAWGGPVAQIAMIRQELVEEEGWIGRERFNRVLAVYQILPGPEAHELCVYFGMLARGRWGGFLAGLGFMLPGFVLMFALSWFYVQFGLHSPFFAALFAGCQPAVVALIVRAVHRIGKHVLADGWLWLAAAASGIAFLVGINFLLVLVLAGGVYVLVKRPLAGPSRTIMAALAILTLLAAAAVVIVDGLPQPSSLVVSSIEPEGGRPPLLQLFYYGLRSGLLTFGGAYTVIPFLQHDAVVAGGFMTNDQFLDGLALSGILPAPLIIFSTFVGYLGGGLPGALLLTLGVFLPAFCFTLVGYEALEKLVENQALHTFLDGVTAGVVGLITATAVNLAREVLIHPPAWAIFALSLFILYRWKAKAAVAGVVLGAGLLGLLVFL